MQITLEVKDITDKLTLRNHVGTGSFGDVPVKLASSIPDASPVITVGDKMYLVSIYDIAKAIIEQVVEGS